MIAYLVNGDDYIHYATLAEAHEAARFMGDGASIERLKIATDKATILRILNCQGGYVTATLARWELTASGDLLAVAVEA